MEKEVAAIVGSVKPLKFQGNKNDKINTALIIKRWNLESLMLHVKKSTSPDVLVAVRIAVQLCEFDFHLIERAIERVGVAVCESVLKQVLSLLNSESPETLVENRDEFFTADGRRRAPGGMYWRILKAAVSSDDAKYIFKDNTKRQQGIRRELVRDRWTENHLTILSKKPRKPDPTVQSNIDAVKEIARALAMSEVSIIERLVVKKSVDYAFEILRETQKILASNDNPAIAIVVDQECKTQRRRTPGGIFAQLLKSRLDISESEKRFIFARARGGQAPSMSDLMSMSLAMVDRVVGPKKTDETSWEFQKKVGSVWEPGFIGAENFSNNLPSLGLDESELLTTVAKGLKITNETDFVERLTALIAPEIVRRVYRETVLVEEAGGLVVSPANPRRRTPKGVFITLLRKEVPADLVRKLIEGYLGLGEYFLFPDLGDPVVAKSRLADKIVVELERMRIPESDYAIVRRLVNLKGELFVGNLFEKVRKRFNKGKWLDTPGQLFARMLKSTLNGGGLTNDELNQVFCVRKSVAAVPQVAGASEQCVRDVTLGLALIGVTASDVVTIERVVERLGEGRAKAVLFRTRELEMEGGQRTRDGTRRKTPSGVYLSLLTSEEKIPSEDIKYIFEQKKKSFTTPDERKKEDSHFAPSLFTPVNPFRVIDNSGNEFIEKIKGEIRPALSQLEYISVLDPRLETIVRGLVLLGRSQIGLIEKCVYSFGEKRTEGWLQISHSQVASDHAPKETLPRIYNELVKAAGGFSNFETTGSVRC